MLINNKICTSKNTCIVVVTYNPSIDFCKNACQYLNIVEQVVIVDNGSNEKVENLIPPHIIQHFYIIRSKENKGIAWALNRGIEWGISHGFQYILTFDQDSYPSDTILMCYGEVLKNNSNIGLIGTSYSIRPFEKLSRETVDTLTIITSGTLHPIETVKKVGFYKEELFIDSVDFDYSLRVKKLGYKVVRTKIPYIIHNLGNPIKRFGIVSSNHSIVRRYYMARNHVYICKKYGLIFPHFVLKKNLYFFRTLVQMIIVESNKCVKLKSTIKGFIDGFSIK